MTIPSCGTACFNQATLYFALWSMLIVVAFALLVRRLNRMFVPTAQRAKLPADSAPATISSEQHAV